MAHNLVQLDNIQNTPKRSRDALSPDSAAEYRKNESIRKKSIVMNR